MKFGEFVKMNRVMRNMTKKEIVEKGVHLGGSCEAVSIKRLSEIENGDKRANYQQAKDLVDVLDLSFEQVKRKFDIKNNINWVDTKKGSEITGYSKGYISNLAKNGEVKAKKSKYSYWVDGVEKIGLKWFISKNDLINYTIKKKGKLKESNTEWINIRKAAELAGKTKPAIKYWINNDKIKYKKTKANQGNRGYEWFVDKKELKEIINNKEYYKLNPNLKKEIYKEYNALTDFYKKIIKKYNLNLQVPTVRSWFDGDGRCKKRIVKKIAKELNLDFKFVVNNEADKQPLVDEDKWIGKEEALNLTGYSKSWLSRSKKRYDVKIKKYGKKTYYNKEDLLRAKKEADNNKYNTTEFKKMKNTKAEIEKLNNKYEYLENYITTQSVRIAKLKDQVEELKQVNASIRSEIRKMNKERNKSFFKRLFS